MNVLNNLSKGAISAPMYLFVFLFFFFNGPLGFFPDWVKGSFSISELGKIF